MVALMEMKSNLSDDPENDLRDNDLRDSGSHIRTGARVVHANHSPLSGEIQRRRTVNSPAAAAFSDANPHLNININSRRYAKKDTRRHVPRTGQRNKIILFSIIPVLSGMVGFYWMSSSLDTSPKHHLRHEVTSVNTLKPRANAEAQIDGSQKKQNKSEESMKNIKTVEKYNSPPAPEDTKKKARKKSPRDIPVIEFKDGDEDARNEEERNEKGTVKKIEPNERKENDASELKAVATQDEHVEKDTSSSKDRFKSNTAALEVNHSAMKDNSDPKSGAIINNYPYTILLQGWNTFGAYRMSPFAKDDEVVTKNVDPDYGQIAYTSLRHKTEFARTLPEDGHSVGGFDPNLKISTSKLKKGAEKRKKDGAHPHFRTAEFDPKAEGVSPEQLEQFFDDDRVRIVKPSAFDDDKSSVEEVGACRALEWEFSYYPTCNAFHEIDISRPFDDPRELTKPRPENSMKVNYINHGYYRDVFIVEDNPWLWPNEYKTEHLKRPTETLGVEDEEEVLERISKAYRSAVLKTFNWERNLDDEGREMVNVEAVVMERLKKSPRIMDIYGHCGFSVMAEVVPTEFEEVVIHKSGYASRDAVEERHKDGLRPYNNFTVEEKLGFALTMAESIADLHGFEDGVIVHDDIQLCQWLRLPDGTMKLGDFNRATIMEYDVINDKYCKFNNGEAFGNYRAPEEFAAKDLDEKIDVFSFGNNIYAMLNGLWGFYDLDDDESTQDALIAGKLPYVDPRWKEMSYIERRLVELMLKCWEFDPDDRVDIFYAVEFLKQTVSEYNRMKEQEKK